MAGKKSFPPRLDIWYPPLESEDSREPTEAEDRDGEDDEPPRGEREGRVVPSVEGHSRSEVDKHGAIGEKVDRARKVGLFDRLGKPVVPSATRNRVSRSRVGLEQESN